MQRRHDEVPGHCGMKRRQGRVGIANFADENDIGILAENGAECPGKGEAGFLVDLNLANAIDLVLDGIFDGDNVDRFLPDLIHQCIEGCRLSAAGWTDREQHALRPPDQAMQLLFDMRLESELRERHQ